MMLIREMLLLFILNVGIELIECNMDRALLSLFSNLVSFVWMYYHS